MDQGLFRYHARPQRDDDHGEPSAQQRGVMGPEREKMQRMWFLDPPSVKDGNIVVMGDVCCGVDQDDQLEADQQVVDSLSFDTASD